MPKLHYTLRPATEDEISRLRKKKKQLISQKKPGRDILPFLLTAGVISAIASRFNLLTMGMATFCTFVFLYLFAWFGIRYQLKDINRDLLSRMTAEYSGYLKIDVELTQTRIGRRQVPLPGRRTYYIDGEMFYWDTEYIARSEPSPFEKLQSGEQVHITFAPNSFLIHSVQPVQTPI